MAAALDQAAVDKRAKEIETEYLSSLADLNVNSKPLINMLTILAEENLDYAGVIVTAVEKHLAKVQSDVKLPILYLVDSIVKNVGKQYQALFSQVIVGMFCGVFETVNERVREKMFSLRQTWNDVFPQSKLFTLDIKINSIDPGWPITASITKTKSPAIHVNPMFLKNKVTEPSLDMQQQLRDKQRELLELQARKLELELLATKKHIEEQEKQLVLQTASVSKESIPDLKRSTPANCPAQPAALVPPPRGRIVPPTPAMINLVKSRDPRLARQQAQLAAQMAAASTNSTPTTVVGGVPVPAQPIAFDPSGKPLSIRERLGRIPKRVDPRLKAQGSGDADRKKVSSTTTSSSSSSSSTATSHKSRNDNDVPKKRERKDELGTKPGKNSAARSSQLLERKKYLPSDSSPSKNTSLVKKRSGSFEKLPSRSEKSSKQREGRSSKSSKRRSDETSKSPENTSVSSTSSSEHLMAVANESKDVDLRLLMPEKKLRLDTPQLPPKQQAMIISKPLTEKNKVQEETLSAENVPVLIKDVDLRIPPPVVLRKDLSETNAVSSSTGGLPVVAANNSECDLESNVETVTTTAVGAASIVPSPGEIHKKRSSSGIGRLEEPNSKKSKSEKIDRLFGDQDVDLRKFAGPMNPVEVSTPLPPPPPIISDAPRPIVSSASVSDSLEKQPPTVAAPSSKAALQAVRAKIAEATKNKDRDKSTRPLLFNKLPDETVDRRRPFSQPKPMDVDLRQVQPPPILDTSNDDNSQDGMNANIKTIIAQAQEQMEKGEITSEQYNILMKQVIQLNETQKIRQAQRMEIMKRTHPIIPSTNPSSCVDPDEVISNSASNDDAVACSAVLNDDTESKQAVPDVAIQKNDFRGKIAPMDAKSKFEASFANATAADLRQRDPRRQRESRFNQQPWGNRGPIAMPPAVAASVPIINNRPPGPMLNPWEQPPFPVMDQSVAPPIGPRFPPIPMNTNGPPAPVLIPGVAKLNDSVRTINIDGIQREIRFYDDIAVIFMSWDEPKEIGFQKGSRMVVVDDRDSFELSFNECYKSITIEGKVYQMKLGSPTRELYIDNNWYECYFGDPPSNIMLDGVNRVFKISGPAPQVKIGNSRNDLVAGKINMIVNAETIIPVFLDAQVQMFEIQGQIHKLQFADFLLTVIINDLPYPIEYGGLPKVFKLRGKDFYIRFTAVPKLVVPGRVYLRDMIRTPLHRDLRTPPRDQSLLPPFVSSITNVMPPIPAPPPVPGLFPAAVAIQQQSLAAPLAMQSTTGLDYITNLMPHTSSAVSVSGNLAGYKIESDDKPIIMSTTVSNSTSSAASSAPLHLPILQNINIDELYKKIVAAGIITKTTSAPTSTTSAPAAVASKLDKALEEDFMEIEPVYLNKHDTLKRRQQSVISQLYTGMQCSSCGVRFPPEQTMKYSQHLDWHFRQNRRDRDSTRKAHSRKWYYNVSDWIQYEEIEDLDEREKNWFETQQTEQTDFNGDGEQSGRTVVDSPSLSCPAGSDELDKRCHMCHDEFEQFYNEEIEEWHLRNAIRVDENTYHPLCYEDYKASLTLDETALNVTNEDGDQNMSVDKDEVKIKQETIKDPNQTEITLDDDDDVIVLPPTEDVVTEIPDDDDIETLDSLSTTDDHQVPSAAVSDDVNMSSGSADSPTSQQEASSKEAHQPRIIETRIDDDITIQEPSIEKIDVNDLDESEEMDVSRASATTEVKHESSRASSLVKVKEEPKDDDEDDEEDALFEDVGTIESSMIVEKEADTVDVEAVPSPISALESTSQVQLKPSIDGNMEVQDTPSTGVITNKIKINITKSKTTTSNSTTGSNIVNASANSSGNACGGSSIAVLISGGAGVYSENSNDDLLYGNLDDVQGQSENSQNSSNQLIMMMPEDEEVDDKNKVPVTAAEEEPTDISYVLKPSMKGIDFIKKPRVENGLETSGLCSIM